MKIYFTLKNKKEINKENNKHLIYICNLIIIL